MLKFSSIILKAAVLLCIIPFVWSCGDSKESGPVQPKVVSQKIVIQQPPKPEASKAEEKVSAAVEKPAAATGAAAQSSVQTAKVSETPPASKTPATIVPVESVAAAAKAEAAKAEIKPVEKDAVAPSEEESATEFAYTSAGRADPFQPLFQEKAAIKEAPAQESADSEKKAITAKKKVQRVPRTPLERMDLSQLKLVAIIRSDRGNRALVQDASGKGYVLNKGTYIGVNSGIVKQIEKDKVIVEEEVEDVYGKSSLREREMILQKPLGEI